MNLVLAFLWLIGGVGVMIYEAIYGPLKVVRFGPVSVAWFCYVLSAYNFVRWYSQRMAKIDEQSERLVEAARARQRADRPRPEPDPTFDFTDRPNPPMPPRDVPPSNN